MKKDYSAYLIKSYQYWDVNIHKNQGYLGRCVIWCKRNNALELTDITEPETQELLLILRNLREASIQCFNPDWFNYAFLGNIEKHLHAHFIPRYSSPRIFGGTVFEDKLYGENYKTDPDFAISEEILQAIRLKIKNALENP